MLCLMRHSSVSASINAGGEQRSRKKANSKWKRNQHQKVKGGRKTVTSRLRQFNDTLENYILCLLRLKVYIITATADELFQFHRHTKLWKPNSTGVDRTRISSELHKMTSPKYNTLCSSMQLQDYLKIIQLIFCMRDRCSANGHYNRPKLP